MKQQIILLAAICLLFSCSSNNAPKGILKQDKMQAVLWDVLRADAFTFQFVTKDTSKKPETEAARLRLSVFASHKISREDFDRSYAYYKEHPEILQPMLDSMISKYTRDKFINTQSKQPSPVKKDSITPQ